MLEWQASHAQGRAPDPMRGQFPRPYGEDCRSTDHCGIGRSFQLSNFRRENETTYRFGGHFA
jgi:hypothetical protein